MSRTRSAVFDSEESIIRLRYAGEGLRDQGRPGLLSLAFSSNSVV